MESIRWSRFVGVDAMDSIRWSRVDLTKTIRMSRFNQADLNDHDDDLIESIRYKEIEKQVQL